ncbi:hypothetical protein CEE44_02055 [Candidatus Woesearchaeota archaeon B3_Woes]|nr:MAG: hypothetical protein CEE44_02055 [Candidatus Woesearchaeota archaeon B3_Woes]
MASVAVISPITGQNVSGNILLNATTDAAAVNVTFKWIDSNGNYVLNTTIYNTTGGQTTFENTSFPTTTLLNDGIYNLTVNATNSSGTIVGNISVTGVTVDNTQPNVVTINAPSTGANYSASITSSIVLNATVNDTTLTVDTVFFNISNGTDPFTTGTATQSGDFWNITLDLTTLAETTHTITVWANDTVGNINNSESVSITIDNTAPIVTLVNSSFNTTDNTPSITFNYTDALFATVNCSLYFSGTSYGSNTSTANATDTTITASTVPDGTHTVNVNCTDGSGNEGNSSSITIKVTTPSTPSSNGGGGNGIKKDFTRTVSLTSIGDKITKLERNSKLEFKLGRNPHSLTIKKVYPDRTKIDLVIESSPIYLTLIIGKPQTIDVGEDELLYIELVSIMSGKVDMIVKKIPKKQALQTITLPKKEEAKKEIVEETLPEVSFDEDMEETTPLITKEEGKSIKELIIISIISLIIIISFISYFFIKKKKFFPFSPF